MLPAIQSALSGLHQNQNRFVRAADSISRWGLPGEDGAVAQRIDLAREMVETIEARHGYGANALVIRTADEMLGSLLDTFS